jgi:hypothetical protein
MDGCTRTTRGLGLDLHLILLVEGALHGGGDGLEESGMTRKKNHFKLFFIKSNIYLQIMTVLL